MKSSSLFIAAIAITAIAIIFYSLSNNPEDASEYGTQLQKEREEKDEFMRSGEGSPFESDTSGFAGLKYFPPDLKYKVTADLEPVENKKVAVLPTSDGKESRYLEYAYANFQLSDAGCRLLILEVMDSGPFRGTLFLAFADETSAWETYGAGRYLDLKKVPGATSIILDFNKAYNPYCAYSDTFSCPLPPRENILKVAIRAGEMSYHP